MRTTSCENIFSACSRSYSSRPESLHLRRLRHHGGGETSTKTKPSKCPITEHRTVPPRHHYLQRLLPSPKMRPQRVPRGASISTICVKGIANITRFAHLLVLIIFIPREISRLQRNKLPSDFMRSSHDSLQAAIGQYRGPVTGGRLNVGGSLLRCCCWPGAAFDSIGYMHIVPAQEETFTLNYRNSSNSRELLFQ